jgi:alginate O-acetyltransferase complex protein AlgI
MLFNSIPFVIFSAVFFPVYFVTRGVTRRLVMLSASYIFYGWWDWRFLGLIVFSTAVDFIISIWMKKVTGRKLKKLLLIASLFVNLGLLGLFKYFDFFAQTLLVAAESVGVSLSWTTLNLVLPVGISFYTFQTLSYTFDVYRGKLQPETDYLRFSVFVALFPQLVAGPIVRASKLLPQLQFDSVFCWSDVLRGIELIAWGVFLKIVLADTIGSQISIGDSWFANPEAYGAAGLSIAAVLFSFQIYGDFAGYSLIAIGLGRIMGLDFGTNFVRPYFATNFSEFWSRWHISLSSWLRDYLYIPLGGNRRGTIRTFANLTVTMFLGGLWHGAAWSFICWGLLHGFFLILSHGVEIAWAKLNFNGVWGIHRAMILIPIILVYSLTTMAWIFFRTETIGDATTILSKILTFDQTPQITQYWFGLVKCFAVVSMVLIADLFWESAKFRIWYMGHPLRRACGLLVVFWCIPLLGTFTGTSFIYFQF